MGRLPVVRKNETQGSLHYGGKSAAFDRDDVV
jgi:hypothetical protein